MLIADAHILAEDTNDVYAEHLDQIISTEFPDKQSESSLLKLTKNFQLPSHSRTCWEGKNDIMRIEIW